MAEKSKLPDLKEISGMAGKLIQDVKKSVTEIVHNYKSKHPEEESNAETASEDKPAPDAKTTSEDKSASDVKTASEDKPASDAKTASEDKPASDAKTASEDKPEPDANKKEDK